MSDHCSGIAVNTAYVSTRASLIMIGPNAIDFESRPTYIYCSHCNFE